MSLRDEKELSQIDSNIQFNSETGRWVASYPWVKDPETLPHNRGIALAILRSTEKRLAGNVSYAELYSRQIQDLIDRGAARLVEESELKEY